MSGAASESASAFPPDKMDHILRVFAAVKTYLIVVTCVLVWDSLSTLSTEIRFIWKASPTQQAPFGPVEYPGQCSQRSYRPAGVPSRSHTWSSGSASVQPAERVR